MNTNVDLANDLFHDINSFESEYIELHAGGIQTTRSSISHENLEPLRHSWTHAGARIDTIGGGVVAYPRGSTENAFALHYEQDKSG